MTNVWLAPYEAQSRHEWFERSILLSAVLVQRYSLDGFWEIMTDM